MKRFLFIIASIILSSTTFFIYFVDPNSRNWVLFVLILIFTLLSAIFIKLVLKKVSVFTFVILPSALLFGLGAVSIFFPNLNLYFLAALWLGGTFAFYITFLILNIYAVVLEKDVKLPLLRAASATAALISSLALFLIFTAIYKVDAVFAVQGILIFLATYLVNRFYFWSATVDTPISFEKEAFLGALVAFEISVATAFMPLEAFFRGFLLISIAYVVNGLLLSRLKHSLSRRVVAEYVSVLVFVLILLVSFNF